MPRRPQLPTGLRPALRGFNRRRRRCSKRTPVSTLKSEMSVECSSCPRARSIAPDSILPPVPGLVFGNIDFFHKSAWRACAPSNDSVAMSMAGLSATSGPAARRAEETKDFPDKTRD